MTTRENPFTGEENPIQLRTVHELTIICTDVGQHPPSLLGRYQWSGAYAGEDQIEGAMVTSPDASARPKVLTAANTAFFPPAPGAGQGRGSRGSYRLVCKRCGRDWRIRHDRWSALLKEIFNAGIHRVDLSRFERA